MASDWIPSRNAIELLRAGGEQNPEDRLRRALQDAELYARAGVVRTHLLSTITVGNPHQDSSAEHIYYLDRDRFLDLRKELNLLSEGRHHLSVRGDHYTVILQGSRIRIFLESDLLEKPKLNQELAPSLWEWANINFTASAVVFDNIEGLIRTRATQVEFYRTGVERLSPTCKALSPQPKKRGRPKTYNDWSEVKKFAEQFIRNNPGKISRADVIDRILLHLEEISDNVPSESTVKLNLKSLFDELLPARNLKNKARN
ncbi:hypothetical protein IYY11_11930 [Methylocystis sp. H62]|uniref:hypothetical protein n=1 Tax=Methylocystis sp. H62 TaxID=2785789 RepID=UPI0018C2B46D|nr:hypothetical protein [Methylocystis sp. H62]MBG0794077.1 hypothetical protein [Methylocystis sp. H62]